MTILKRLKKLEKRMGGTVKNIITMTPEAFKSWLACSTGAQRESGVAILEGKVFKVKPLKYLLPDEVRAELGILEKIFAIWNFDRDPEAALVDYEYSCRFESDLLNMTPDEIRARIAALDREIEALERSDSPGGEILSLAQKT